MSFPYDFSFEFPEDASGPPPASPLPPPVQRTVRGFRWANVPGGRPDMYPMNASSVSTVDATPIDDPSSLSGVLVFRRGSVPVRVRG